MNVEDRLSVPFRLPALSRIAGERPAVLVALVFGTMMLTQGGLYLVLGTGSPARGLSASAVALGNLLAVVCAWRSFQKAQGTAAAFWFLFAVAMVALLIPNALYSYQTLFHHSPLSDSTWRLLYCLHGAPIMMMLFLPDAHHEGRVKWEVFLDLFQVAVAVGLAYSIFFFIPVQAMSAPDAILRTFSVSNANTIFLLLAALVRLRFAQVPAARNLLFRLSTFLCASVVATLVGDWIDQHGYAVASAWFDLGWACAFGVATAVSFTWQPPPMAAPVDGTESFSSFLRTSLVLVAMLSGVQFLIYRWKAVNEVLLANVAIAATLTAFAFRLALTQYRQYQEIAQRKKAQGDLSAANEKIGILLSHARRQVTEITQVSELGNVLQACASKEEAFRVIPERMRRIFPGHSGIISLLSGSKNHVESVAEWGPCPPADRIFSPDQCWALRRGCVHSNAGEASALKCSHLQTEGASVCIPLIADGEALGTFALQENMVLSDASDAGDFSDSSSWRRQLASAVAENIALAVANLHLREAVRLRAIRDPLTGLYNRRYMQEFLDRELSRAIRRQRSVAVLMIDLDYFSHYNNKYGHGEGDQVLAKVGEILLRSVRAEDLACRYGGEEFCVILSECSLQQAAARADEIRKRLRESSTHNDTQPRDSVTASIGVAAYGETTDRSDLLLRFADEALQRAKREGRDRVVKAKPAAAGTEGPQETEASRQSLGAVFGSI